MSAATSRKVKRLPKNGLIIFGTSLTLFSMFFGAGNLIFPPLLGVEAGSSFVPAIIGFLGTGVLLPVLAIVAIALSGNNARDLASRAGVVFGIAFPVLAYLSIGAFYALPRTGAVSFESAVTPLTGWTSTTSSILFNIVFFAVALLLSWNQSKIVDYLGRFLTPALLILLVVLIVIAVMTFDPNPSAPVDKYDGSPVAAGLLEGYMTMDALAALAFGILVISAMRHKGVPEGTPIVRNTVLSTVIAGVLLACIYVGLGYIGYSMPGGEQFDNGATLLSSAADEGMGSAGKIVFGLIVTLACMTTAVGLISATSEFFESLIPKVNYHAWCLIFSLLSVSLAALGLETVLSVAEPIIGFLYPPAIALITLTIFGFITKNKVRLFYTFRLVIWVTVAWSAMMTLSAMGLPIFDGLLGISPLNDVDLGWIVPALIALVVGIIVDAMTRTPEAAAEDSFATEDAEDVEVGESILD